MPLTSPKREARYRQLLEAALTVFARDGIDGASVADIAESAGVAKGSVYLYFDSKEALAGDLVRFLFSHDDGGPRLSQEPEPLLRLLSFCEVQETRIQDLGPNASIVLHMLGHVGKSADDQLGRGMRQLMAETRFAIRVLLQRATELGLLPGCDDCTKGASIVLAAMFGTIQMQLSMSGLTPKLDLRVRDTIKVLLKGFGAQL